MLNDISYNEIFVDDAKAISSHVAPDISSHEAPFNLAGFNILSHRKKLH